MTLRLPTIRIEARIAFGLVSIFVALLMLLDVVFGLVPDRASVELESRQRTAYNLALLLTHTLDDSAVPHEAVAAMARRDPQVLSVALRRADGTPTPIVGDHRTHWTLADGARSTLTHVRVPLLSGERVWAHLEIAFRPVYADSLAGWLAEPSVRALLLLVLASTGLVYLYLRRVLQHLDPGQVIPRRVRDAFDVLDEGVLVLDGQARVMMVNEAFRRLDPFSVPVRIGRPVTQFEWLTGALRIEVEEPPWKAALRLGTPPPERELLIADPGGRTAREAVIKATPIFDATGQARGSMVTLTDVSSLHRLNRELTVSMRSLADSREQLKQQNEDLQRLATRDPLTGCLNRRAFFDLAERAIYQARTRGTPTSCLMVDIDHFKQFNDRHGHAVGDQVIKAVAAMLSNGVRGTDLVCRYGGEEFCVLVTPLDSNGALLLAQRLRADIEASAALHVGTVPELRITASVGVAHFATDIDRLETLVDRADQALYQSKRAGRNRVTRWTTTTGNEASASAV
ncbi:sensor domain-containing diguanylate cyclase [Piscinibacter sp.]|uniref:sensor domain-containing diguanylate cyclase n=1 Tax=Piscinibacter sp. TaxID=1903157 RepID=UPI002C33488C|nr:sensor domain-containing diguanylate cyclase [Albitalea sp.]HUG25246.1 sensor domain-containing diguanylate cyclase [Albitalea sp.]